MSRSSTLWSLATRFLRSQTSDKFVGMVSVISVVGIVLGVMALTVVVSVINGVEGEVIRHVTALHGDVILTTHGNPMSDPKGTRERIEKVVPEAFAVQPSFLMEVMATGPSGSVGAAIEGMERGVFWDNLAKRLAEGSRMPEAHDEVILGRALSERLGLKVGSAIRIVAPFVGGGLEGGGLSVTPKARGAVVVGIVDLGMYQYDSKYVFGRLDFVQDLLEQPNRVTTFKLKLKQIEKDRNPGLEKQIVDRLENEFGYPYRSRFWGQLNHNLLSAIQLDKAVLSVLLTAIIFVAAFNVVTTLMLLIQDKQKELALLRAIGLSQIQGFGLFSFLGLGLGGVGALFGILGGWVFLEILTHIKWIEVPANVYPVSYLPSKIIPSELLWIAGITVLLCWLASLYPALKVSKQNLSTVLRRES